jgi:hypothetical protein
MKNRKMSLLVNLTIAMLLLVMAASTQAATSCVKQGGGGACFGSIQDAIDNAAAGDTIKVYPGSYDERASGRYVLDGTPLANGPHQFGLFISRAKSGITIQGVDAKGKDIKEVKKVQTLITTNASNDFGPSGIFVEGDSVTLAGLGIGANSAGQNKTIEIIGDDFTMTDCDISDLGGSVYFGDWQFDTGTDTSHIQTYRLEGNNFQDGVSIDLTNGAGLVNTSDHDAKEALKRRLIRHNSFANSNYWPSISFNGSGTGVPWFVYSVGGAIIKENEFVNTFVLDGDPLHAETEGHIRARGTYDNDEFDWESYWNDNKFNAAYVVGPKPPRDLRTYSYLGFYGTFKDVRRIGAIFEAEQAHAQPGDKILKKKDH